MAVSVTYEAAGSPFPSPSRVILVGCPSSLPAVPSECRADRQMPSKVFGPHDATC